MSENAEGASESARSALLDPPLRRVARSAGGADRGAGRAALRAEVGATVRLAGPVVLSSLSMMTMGFVDTLVVGRLGPVALAGVSLANAVFFTVLVFFAGILKAVEPTVAQAVGAGSRERACEAVWSGLWLAALVSVPLVLMFRDAEWLLSGLGAEPEVARLAAVYLAPRSLAVPAFLAFVSIQGLLHGLGRPRPVLAVALLANLVNGAADLLLVHGSFGLPALGVAGAGWATAASRWFMLVALAAFLLRRGVGPGFGSISFAPRRPRLRSLRRLVGAGLPIAGSILAEVSFFCGASVAVAWMGALAQAGHQIAMNLASFTFMVPLGLGTAAGVRVGQAVGRGDRDAAARAGRVALGLGTGFMAFAGVGFLAAPWWLARMFTDDAALIESAVPLIRLAGAFAVFDGAQAVAAGCLRGAGELRSPFVIGLLAYWAVGLPLGLGLAFGAGLGAAGLWIAFVVALGLAAVILVGRFLSGSWREAASLVD